MASLFNNSWITRLEFMSELIIWIVIIFVLLSMILFKKNKIKDTIRYSTFMFLFATSLFSCVWVIIFQYPYSIIIIIVFSFLSRVIYSKGLTVQIRQNLKGIDTNQFEAGELEDDYDNIHTNDEVKATNEEAAKYPRIGAILYMVITATPSLLLMLILLIVW